MSFESIFGYIALITSVIGLIPQSYKAFQTRSTEDISMFMVINYFVCSIAWIIYGTIILSAFVVVSDVIGAITSLVLIMQKYHYDARENKQYAQ